MSMAPFEPAEISMMPLDHANGEESLQPLDAEESMTVYRTLQNLRKNN